MFPNYLNWTRTRACCTPSCRYTRCLRCSSCSGPRDYVSISNFNHVAEVEAASTWRHVRYLLQISFKESETEQIFTIVISNQFKTGVRMRLTSSVKELEAILQKLIKFEPGLNPERNWLWLAMRIDSFNSCERLETFGPVRMEARNGNNFVLSRTGNEKKKESRLNSVKLVKRKIQSVIN